MRSETCFGCGKEFYELYTPMRCEECFKKKIPIGTSPVSDAYWKLCECGLCLSERTEFIARGAAEQILKDNT